MDPDSPRFTRTSSTVPPVGRYLSYIDENGNEVWGTSGDFEEQEQKTSGGKRTTKVKRRSLPRSKSRRSASRKAIPKRSRSRSKK